MIETWKEGLTILKTLDHGNVRFGVGEVKRSGIADLRLHGGQVPRRLLSRMRRLCSAIISVMVDEYGTGECLRKFGDPLWFQSLSNVLGFDWDSSGSTTVTCAVLKGVMDPHEHGIVVAGGKGGQSRNAPNEIQEGGRIFNLGEDQIDSLVYATRMAPKVDNAVLQDGHALYHHVFFFDGKGHWAVVQQGMDTELRSARRYHWIHENLRSFIEEPHTGIISSKTRTRTLDLTSSQSQDCREVCNDLAKEGVNKLQRLFEDIRPYSNTSLLNWVDKPSIHIPIIYHKIIPHRMNWNAVKKVYDLQPEGFEELVAVRGMGPGTIRGLALISELVYGSPPSWRDPVKYSFNIGGKDGVPFPINYQRADRIIQFLKQLIDQAKLSSKEKWYAFRQLKKFTPNVPSIEY